MKKTYSEEAKASLRNKLLNLVEELSAEMKNVNDVICDLQALIHTTTTLMDEHEDYDLDKAYDLAFTSTMYMIDLMNDVAKTKRKVEELKKKKK